MWDKPHVNYTRGNRLHRVQRCACKIILNEEFTSYEAALDRLNLDYLCERRKRLVTRFAKKMY